MATIITSPVAGSLKITTTSASPQSRFLCNLQTASVFGSLNYPQHIFISNADQLNIFDVGLANITSIGASGSAVFSGSIQNAIDAIASLIMK